MQRTFPHTRHRRLKQTSWSRALNQETTLTCKDLILPLFVHDSSVSLPIKGLPGQYRLSLKDCLKQAEKAASHGIPAIALFPAVDPDKKNLDGSESLNPNNILNQSIRALKQAQLPLGIITDVALDPYTSHGHDGLINNDGQIDNDATIQVLAKQALLQTEQGADVVAPSDMQDGRIGLIRQTLEDNGHTNTLILAYTAKYASSFYGPFREAIGAGKLTESSHGPHDKKTYQMQIGNQKEALHMANLHAHEGADLLMVKPAMPYLDVIHRLSQHTHMPILAYQVSGEYAMLKALANGDIPLEQQLFHESLIACKRAKCQSILTYYALELAKLLSNQSLYKHE